VFTSVSRPVVWRDLHDAGWHEVVECAVRSDGSSPAGQWLAEMKAGVRRGDPRHLPPEDREQIHDYWKILAKVEYVGTYGRPERRSDVNDLEAGTWEFRHGVRRLSYWDTPGDGTFQPKLRVKDVRTIPEDERDDFWWYPRMDVVLRLGCAWDKDGPLAPPAKIVEACLIREEDVAHDRTQ
jgi:hypothetical protein